MTKQLDTAGGAQAEGANIIDEGPWPIADVAQLFAEMHPKVLASCWVAVLLDSLIESGLKIGSIGDVARAMNAAALKLNHRPARHERPNRGERRAA